MLRGQSSFDPQATFKVQPDMEKLEAKYAGQAPLGTQTYFGGKRARKELLTLTIEIGEGENETILIREGDDANELASKFSEKYSLDPEL